VGPGGVRKETGRQARYSRLAGLVWALRQQPRGQDPGKSLRFSNR
jgi:hypothetical protein